MKNAYFARYFSTALLVTVALARTYGPSSDALTRWKGGGFGMYSEIHWKERIVWIGSKDTNFKLNINALQNNPSFQELRDKTKRNPSQDNLAKLSDKILRYSNKKPFYVQVWKPKFDPVTAKFTRLLVSEYQYGK